MFRQLPSMGFLTGSESLCKKSYYRWCLPIPPLLSADVGNGPSRQISAKANTKALKQLQIKKLPERISQNEYNKSFFRIKKAFNDYGWETRRLYAKARQKKPDTDGWKRSKIYLSLHAGIWKAACVQSHKSWSALTKGHGSNCTRWVNVLYSFIGKNGTGASSSIKAIPKGKENKPKRGQADRRD